MAALALAAAVLSLKAWGGVRIGAPAYPLALVLAGSAVALLGSPGDRPAGLLRVPLVAGLVLVAIPALGTGYRYGAEMTASGLLLLVGWAGLCAIDLWVRRRTASFPAARDRSWEEVCEDLARARRLILPPADRERLARLDELLVRGELAAALNEMEAAGLSAGAPAEYWRALSSAARQMGLAEACERLARLGREPVSAPVCGHAAPDGAVNEVGDSGSGNL